MTQTNPIAAVPMFRDESEDNREPPAEVETPVFDLSDPRLYLNRELTWLAFNKRVLHEAEDERTPLLERVKFLAIVASNLDEFYMKRIGGLKQQVAAGVTDTTVDGHTPQRQIEEALALAQALEQRQQHVLTDLKKRLEAEDIRICALAKLTEEQRARLREHFTNDIFPVLTPLAMDPGHPFPSTLPLQQRIYGVMISYGWTRMMGLGMTLGSCPRIEIRRFRYPLASEAKNPCSFVFIRG